MHDNNVVWKRFRYFKSPTRDSISKRNKKLIKAKSSMIVEVQVLSIFSLGNGLIHNSELLPVVSVSGKKGSNS